VPYEHVIIEFLLKLQHSNYTLVFKNVCTTSVFQMFVVFSGVHVLFFVKLFLHVLCYMLGLYFYMMVKISCQLTTIFCNMSERNTVKRIPHCWENDKNSTIRVGDSCCMNLLTKSSLRILNITYRLLNRYGSSSYAPLDLLKKNHYFSMTIILCYIYVHI